MNLLVILFPMVSLLSAVDAQYCTGYTFSGNQVFPSCTDLPYLNSFLHWDFNQTSNSVRIAYRVAGDPTGKWVAWGVNPTGRGMIGAQSLVAFRQSNGAVRAYTSPVSDYRTGLQERDLSFPVTDLTASFTGNEVIIFATLKLGTLGTGYVNQVWQEGPVYGDSPAMHFVYGPNLMTMRALNLNSGAAVYGGGVVNPGVPGGDVMNPGVPGGDVMNPGMHGGVNSLQRAKNIHGVLNAVGWGILLPIGVIMARYLRVFDWASPAWFYIHISCQSAGYIIGAGGWAIRNSTWRAVSRNHLHGPSSHRYSHFQPGHGSGYCSASEAQKGQQVQILLEHIPPICRLLPRNPRRHQHFQRLSDSKTRSEMEESIHRSPCFSVYHCCDSRNLDVDRGHRSK